MTAKLLPFLLSLLCLCARAQTARPNILLCIADDASWHHFSANGDKVCRTPVFDRVAREGVNFRHSYCSSPSCTPSRGALLTGQQFWRLEDGANLWSRWPNKAAVYPDLLAAAGYHVGLKGKGWGPGDATFTGRAFNPSGPGVRDFETFLKNKPADKPFCFWFGSQDPHRMYERGSGVKSGMKIEEVTVPPYLPDTPEVRSDILDYYFEVQRFDRDIGAMLKLLEDAGQLDNTLVVITSDNGWPFPRGKAGCYDAGARMPLAMRWPARVPGSRTVDDFVSHTDLAPTFLEAAGLPVPADMTGKSLLPLLTGGKPGQVEPARDKVFFGRERHASVRAGNVSYPVRAVRTADFLYLRNYEPARWPAGDPPIYGDVDQHHDITGSPSKQAVVQHDDSDAAKKIFALSFAKRPAEELYDLRTDPYQLQNLAGDARHADAQKKLRTDLDQYLTATKDPRAAGQGAVFDHYHYVTGAAERRNGSDPQFTDVFTSGAEGYASIRIPSVIVTKAGTVLAFAEGRQRPTDQAENDIVMKRSTDGGRTWSALKVLHDDGAHSLNNPTVVQEQQSGRIFLWYQRIPSHLKEHDKKIATGLEGPDIYRSFILTSDDDGMTWSAPQDVTATTKRPQRATTIASGPGIGIQLTRGPHKGRLLIPFNEGPYGIWQNYAVFSDDAGKTWSIGDDVPNALMANGKSWINEVQIAELSDGSVRLATRQFGGAKVRKTSTSKDGGKTWSPAAELPQLTDPSCMAGLLRYSFDGAAGKGRLLHTGPDSTKRDQGTVWLSTDDGATWPVKRLLWEGGFAYSVPAKLADGTVGVLFEADNYKTIKFVRFPIGWVEGK